MVENINTVLNHILNDFLNDTSGLITSAKYIAGLGALIMAFITYRKIQMEGETTAINQFLIKFALVMIGITFYSTFIKFVNAPLELMTSNVKQISLQNYQETSNVFEQNYQNGTIVGGGSNSQHDEEINNLLNEDDNESSNNQDSNAIVQNTQETGITGTLQAMVFNAIFQILSFLASIALVILNVIRTFFLIILSVFGIFVIALSIYPGFEGSFGQWLQKYVNVYLWLPVAYILDGILSRIMGYQGMAGETFMDESAFSSVLINVLAVCTIVAYATVPTMTSWLVNASTNGMASKVKGKGASIGDVAKKAITKS